ncbi:MAG: hypothetical protein WC783_02665 [Candidatus Paceibacterota bacterium]|jgi:hypothetical protein
MLTNDLFEISTYRSFINQYNLEDEIEFVEEDEFGEELYKVKDSVFAELQRTYELFISRDKADERINNVMVHYENKVMQYLLSLGVNKQVASVEAIFSEHMGSSISVIIKHINGEELTLEPSNAFYDGEINISDAAASWSWAAWLGIDGSPLFTDEFLYAYGYDEVSMWFEEVEEGDWLEEAEYDIKDFFGLNEPEQQGSIYNIPDIG